MSPLRGVQNVMDTLHRRRDADGADVRRSFIGPDGELASSDLQQGPAGERPREQGGEIPRLFEAVDRREHQLDRPLGGDALRLERIGEAEAADNEIRLRGRATARELSIDVGALLDRGLRDLVEFVRDELLVEIRAWRPRSAACRVPAPGKRANDGSICESGKKKMLLPSRVGRLRSIARRARSRPGAIGRLETLRRYTPGVGGGLQPRGRPLGPERERSAQAGRPARGQALRGVA